MYVCAFGKSLELPAFCARQALIIPSLLCTRRPTAVYRTPNQQTADKLDAQAHVLYLQPLISPMPKGSCIAVMTQVVQPHNDLPLRRFQDY